MLSIQIFLLFVIVCGFVFAIIHEAKQPWFRPKKPVSEMINSAAKPLIVAHVYKSLLKDRLY